MTVDGSAVTAMEVNQEALDAYLAEHQSVQDDPLECAVQGKVTEMSEACRLSIMNGIDLDNKHYSLTLEDQLNMMSLLAMVQNGVDAVPYHADGEECHYYTAAEFSAVAAAATAHKLYQESYFNALRGYIQDMTVIEDIEAVYYGTEIPAEYQTDVLKQMLEDV